MSMQIHLLTLKIANRTVKTQPKVNLRKSSDSTDEDESSSSVGSMHDPRNSEHVRTRISEGDGREDEEEMICQLKEKYYSTASRNEKLRVLTVLPKSWSIKKVARGFGVSRYLARHAKKLVTENSILSSPNPKLHGRVLSSTSVEKVKLFYLSDDVSQVMAGKKDFLSALGADGKRVHQQKRLLLCNLREAYNSFKVNYMESKIGFSAFAQPEPRECVQAGASGTHSECVCTMHQNIKLMMEGVTHMWRI